MRRRLFAAPLVCLAVLAGCGDESTTNDSTVATPASDCPAATEGTVAAVSFPDGKPEVEAPAEQPTKLVITDLIEGTGDAAKVGDVVTVNYVGVRSADGTEFDNSYDRGATFPVTLGTGGVIAGWDEGLIGIRSGGRRRLDIPTELAYGDSPRGDIIQPGDALTFVIDAVSIVAGPPLADPATAPVVDVPESVGAAQATTTDLVEGDPCRVAMLGQTAYAQVIVYRGDTGAEIQSSWTTGQPIQFLLDDTTIAGLVDGIVGMGVGGRRLLILPAAQSFGPEVRTQMGLDEGTDVVLVVDLVQLD